MRSIIGITVIVLFGAWPFLHFAVQNVTLHTDIGLSLPRLLGAAVGLIAVTLALWLAVSLLFRRIPADRWAAVIGVGIVAAFLFGAMAAVMQEHGYFRYVQAAVWSLVSTVLLVIVWMLSKSPNFSRKLVIVAVALNLFALIPLVLPQAESTAEPELKTASEAPAANRADPAPRSLDAAKGRRPNVYFFVFDEYARADQLKAVFNLDNGPFLDALAQRGFFVGRRNYANFPATLLSVSSTLSMNLIVPAGEVFDWWGDGARNAKRLIDGFNPVVDKFRRLGYRYIHGGGESYVRCGNAEDRCIRAKAVTWVTEQERLLMLMTPLRLFRYRLRFAAEKFTPTVVKHALGGLTPGPHFVYGHFMIPRSSVYQDDCTTVAALDGLMGVAAVPRHDPALMRQRKKRYANDIKCVNPALLELVDQILATDQDPIIIIQSDHGPTYLHDWSRPDWPDDEFKERYGILNAIRLPQPCRRHLYAGMTPVNTFRIVFACLDGRRPELVPDISLIVGYYSRDPARVQRAGTEN